MYYTVRCGVRTDEHILEVRTMFFVNNIFRVIPRAGERRVLGVADLWHVLGCEHPEDVLCKEQGANILNVLFGAIPQKI